MSVKEIYIMRVRKRFEELGRTPTSNELGSAPIIINKFGSWSNFIEEAGLPKVERKRILTNEELIQAIHNKAKEIGKTPTKSEVPHYDTIKKRFGTYNKALQVAGLKPNNVINKHKQFTEEEMLNCLKNFYCNHHRLPTQQDIRFSGEIPFSVYTLEIKFQKKWSEILKMLDISDIDTMYFYDINKIHLILVEECLKRKKFLTEHEINTLSKENKNIPNAKALYRIFNVNNIYEFWHKNVYDFLRDEQQIK